MHLRLPSLDQMAGIMIRNAVIAVVVCLVLWGIGVSVLRKKG